MHENHFRYSAARTLLSPFLPFTSPGIPADPEVRAEALQAPLRALWDRWERGGVTVHEAAAEVRAIGEALAAGGSAVEGVPKDLRELAERSGAGGEPSVFLDIASYADEWPAGLYARLGSTVPTVWELGLRFPQLTQMLSLYFGQDGIALEDPDLTDVEGIGLFVAECHGGGLCQWRLPPLVAECAEALALFPDEGALSRFFAVELGLGSGSQESWTTWLTLIPDTLTDHLRREHGPIAWTGGREEPTPC
ncbi:MULTISPECIES: hypothetical protein [unclassified Streptomyces]|uniref:hypothetical protein n=1 Tax=unclassified Streptomyces TaxID=2593676 RepID=UPI00093F7F6B|nr:hypothetical protein [Streptomyces sp. TSRI0281]OKI48323.1 hypothetical protein A6A29_04680 [Streptomyces sp. TSRI0281]